MKQSDREMLLHKIDYEGFSYCFDEYSFWKEIKDKKFHELREEYVKAKKALEDYIGLDE